MNTEQNCIVVLLDDPVLEILLTISKGADQDPRLPIKFVDLLGSNLEHVNMKMIENFDGDEKTITFVNEVEFFVNDNCLRFTLDELETVIRIQSVVSVTYKGEVLWKKPQRRAR